MKPSFPCLLAVSLSCLVLQLHSAPPSNQQNQTPSERDWHHSPTDSAAIQHAASPATVRKMVQMYTLIAMGLCLAVAIFGCCFVFVCCPHLRQNVVKGRVVGSPFPFAAAVPQRQLQLQPTAPEIVVEQRAASAAESSSSSSQVTDQQGTPPPSYDAVQRNRASGLVQNSEVQQPITLQAHNPPERPVSSNF